MEYISNLYDDCLQKKAESLAEEHFFVSQSQIFSLPAKLFCTKKSRTVERMLTIQKF